MHADRSPTHRFSRGSHRHSTQNDLLRNHLRLDLEDVGGSAEVHTCTNPIQIDCAHSMDTRRIKASTCKKLPGFGVSVVITLAAGVIPHLNHKL